VGFSRENGGVDIAEELAKWQAARDQQFWKLIVSPEFGGEVDLPKLTRDLLKQMEKDLRTELEWIAVEHHNTEHPHVHIVMRGVSDGEETLRLSREYVKQGIRSIAADLCTRQLGYRTEIDAAMAERRDVTEMRFTSIDRRLLKDARQSGPDPGSQYFTVSWNREQAELSETARSRIRHDVCAPRRAWPYGPRNQRDRTRGDRAGISNSYSVQCSEPPIDRERWRLMAL
jgi:hypothetical protein